MINTILFVTIGGCCGAIASIVLGGRRTEEDCINARMEERSAVQDEYKNLLEEKDNEIQTLKSKINGVEIEEI